MLRIMGHVAAVIKVCITHMKLRNLRLCKKPWGGVGAGEGGGGETRKLQAARPCPGGEPAVSVAFLLHSFLVSPIFGHGELDH